MNTLKCDWLITVCILRTYTSTEYGQIKKKKKNIRFVAFTLVINSVCKKKKLKVRYLFELIFN